MNWFPTKRQPPQQRSSFDELFDISAEDLDSEFREATVDAAALARCEGAPITGVDEHGRVVEVDADGVVREVPTTSSVRSEIAGAD